MAIVSTTYTSSRVAIVLGTTYPLIQAPMSWVTSASLVAAVSNAGGLGVFGPNAGHRTVTHDPLETVERMRAEIHAATSLTDKPFGLNVLFMDERRGHMADFTKHWIAMAQEEGVRHFVSVGDASEEGFAAMKASGGIIIHRPLTPTIANMTEAEALGADILVATGYDEGGWVPEQAVGTFTVVPTMVDAVRVPVMATGGINDRRGVKAAFALGAEGVFVGTRFIVTKESPAAEIVKQKIVMSGFDEMVIVSRRQRSLRSLTANQLAATYADPNNREDLDARITSMGGLRPGMIEGNMDAGIVSVNTGIDIIKTVPSVHDLVAELMS